MTFDWRKKVRGVRAWLPVIFAACCAGLLAQWIGIPAPWLIGPLICTLLFALGGRVPGQISSGLVVVVHAVIGTALSASMQPEYLEALAQNWLPVVGIVVIILVTGLGFGLLLAKVGRLTPATAVLGTMPGAANGLIAMADDMKADSRIVSFIQYARLVVVIILTSLISDLLHPGGSGQNTAPAYMAVESETLLLWLQYGVTIVTAVGGAWLGLKLRLPAGAMIGPLIVGSVVGLLGIPHGTWPPGVLTAAYLLIGVQVGMRFDLPALRLVGRLTPLILAEMVALILVCALWGWLLSVLTGADLLSGYLATNPGGLDTVAAIALDVGANTPLVLATQLLRYLSILILAPPLIRWLMGRIEKRWPVPEVEGSRVA